jgi:ABC-type uncharacterized transport system permease subunit
MRLASTDLLYAALALYGAGTSIALASLLFPRQTGAQRAAFIVMISGFVAHTIFIGTICVRTGHPPLVNLAEIAAFIAWTILLIDLVIYTRLKIYAAAFIVYPLVFLLLLVTAIVGDPFTHLSAAQHASLFTAHLLTSALGVAVLFIGLAFALIASFQDRSLKSKKRGRLWDWIPSLDVCNSVTLRALSAGFVLYTAGLLAGFAWSLRVSPGSSEMHAKQIGALIAWVLFAILLESQLTGFFRTRRTTLALSAAAFAAVMVSIFGIAHA